MSESLYQRWDNFRFITFMHTVVEQSSCRSSAMADTSNQKKEPPTAVKSSTHFLIKEYEE